MTNLASVKAAFESAVQRVAESDELLELVNGLCDGAWDDLEGSNGLDAITACMMLNPDKQIAVRGALVNLGSHLGR